MSGVALSVARGLVRGLVAVVAIDRGDVLQVGQNHWCHEVVLVHLRHLVEVPRTASTTVLFRLVR